MHAVAVAVGSVLIPASAHFRAADGRSFSFLYNQRGHQVLRLVAVDAKTGAARSIVEERSPTFVDYPHKTWLHWLSDTELLWASERDGRIKAAAERPWMDLSRVGIYGGSAGGQTALRALLDFPDFYQVGVADCGCHDNRMDKIWWNELWMGWPVDEACERNSNTVDAHTLQGELMLIVGELDQNVDPASTLQVSAALVKAGKLHELVVIPAAGHGAAETPYGSRKRAAFLRRHLLGE